MQYIIFEIMEGEGNELSRQKGKKKKRKIPSPAIKSQQMINSQ